MKTRTIIALMALLLVSSVAVWKFIPHRLSYNECSDVYRHFADMQLEDVRVTYVKDKVINDTLRMPVTLLEAESNRGWQQIDSLFGYTKTIEEICDMPNLPDSVKHELRNFIYSFYTYRAHRETPGLIANPDDIRPDDITVFIFHNLRCVTIYEPVNITEEYEALMNKSIVNQQEMIQQ